MVISCIIRRIAQIQNVLVAANGKAFDLAKFRVLQLLAQLFSKVGAAGLIILKSHTEAGHRGGFSFERLLVGFCEKIPLVI